MGDEADRILEQADWVDDTGSVAETLQWHVVKRWTKQDREQARLRRQAREARKQKKKDQ